MENRRFTKEELSQYNGKNGTPIYFAYQGKVYDVTNSFLWQNGKHQVLHVAGIDLTGRLDNTVHGEDLLQRFAIVGILVDN